MTPVQNSVEEPDLNLNCRSGVEWRVALHVQSIVAFFAIDGRASLHA